MPAPVDLTNLREMTGGDEEMEKMLFEEFFSSFETGIAGLQATVNEAGGENWKRHAHALKGVSLNLGAQHLSDLCRKAQDDYTADSSAKATLLTELSTEYQEVRAYLSGLNP